MRSLALLLALLSPQLGLSWGMEGHRLIVRIAEGLLSRAAREDIAATLAPGESLVELASWADEVRKLRKETEPWHYVDIPLNSAGFDWKRDCPEGNCVVGKIADFRKIWRDPRASATTRREALLFLVHFVGDLHQPLHCVDMDRWGNDVPVRFRGEHMNLHALWDTALLKQMPEEEQLFSKLSQAIRWEPLMKWSQGTIEDWANESFHIAQQTVYGLLPTAASGETREIGQSYERAAQPVIELQLEKAAVRVAAILNENAR